MFREGRLHGAQTLVTHEAPAVSLGMILRRNDNDLSPSSSNVPNGIPISAGYGENLENHKQRHDHCAWPYRRFVPSLVPNRPLTGKTPPFCALDPPHPTPREWGAKSTKKASPLYGVLLEIWGNVYFSHF